jgi:hypothetical protein
LFLLPQAAAPPEVLYPHWQTLIHRIQIDLCPIAQVMEKEEQIANALPEKKHGRIAQYQGRVARNVSHQEHLKTMYLYQALAHPTNNTAATPRI